MSIVLCLGCAGWRPNKVGIRRAFEVEGFKAKGFKFLPDDSQVVRIIQWRKQAFRISGLALSFRADCLLEVCDGCQS